MAGTYAKKAGDIDDIKDIITFLEAPWGLNMNETTVPLFPGQKFILKAYYKIPLDSKNKTMIIRDKFNERDLYKFTEQQYLEYLYNEGRCNIKYIDDKPRNELVLVVGRRGTKSTLSSWMAAYETYKLLKVYDPQKHYKTTPGDEIQLTCLATSEDQANMLFRQILGHFSKSAYFHRYLNKPTSDRVFIKTRGDLDRGKDASPSLLVRSAACSARGIRGAGNILVIMDEQAHFLESKSNSNKSDKEVYKAVTPSVAQFGDDGKIVNISSPLNKSGLLWELYTQALEGAENILMIQAPSWEINTSLSSSFLKGRYHNDPITYDCEFGGQFSDRVSAWMPEEYLRRVIVPELKPKTYGVPRVPHFVGLDIGLKGDGTSIAVTHVEKIRDDKGELIDKIELDYIEARYAGVYPYEDYEVLDFELISDWFKDICTRYMVVGGLLDQHNGELVAQNLAKKGMSQFEMVYHTRTFNSKLYQNFMMLCIDNKLRLYNDKPEEFKDSELIEEMLKLQVKQYAKNIISVEAPNLKNHHDDLSDALIRSVWVAFQALKNGLVSGRTKSLGAGPYGAVRDANQYQLRKQRFHNIHDTRRNPKKHRVSSFAGKIGRGR